jgi:hypothetical protein
MWTDKQVAEPAVLPHVPDGTHTGEIKFVDFRKKDWAKCDANPNGDVILMLVAVPKYEPFFTDVPCHLRGTVEAVCRAASVAVPVPTDDWDCRVLKGKQVTIETIHGLNKAGRDYVRVERWKAGPAPLPEAVRDAPTRTATKKADAAGHDPDDIPF